MAQIPVIVVAYNRPHSLNRLLISLSKANYNQKTDIIISIDGGGDNDVIKIAEKFNWGHGKKEVIKNKVNLGLRKHILICGDISQNSDGIILLEEDLIVAPEFYNYTLQAYDYYKDNNDIAGIALYSHSFNETAQFPFYPINDGSDVFFMQLACSWGQCWTKKQWKQFREWYNKNSSLIIPENFLMACDACFWPESSWKKYFIKYLIENNKYFVYPRVSLTTNFGDQGQHHNGSVKNFQVPLQYGNKIYNFVDIDKSLSICDSFCEMMPTCLNKFCHNLNKYDYEVDLYGMKPISKIKSKYILTSKKSNSPLFTYGKELIPLESNIIENIKGTELNFSKKDDCHDLNMTNYYQERNLRCFNKKELLYHYNLSSSIIIDQETIEQQKQLIYNSYSYRVGHILLWPLKKIKKFLKSRLNQL